MLLAVGFFRGESVEAGVYDNAYTFYEKKGSDMVFTSSKDEDGEIYFAIVGRESTASIKYKTIGWKVTIEDEKGDEIECFYYDLKGDDVELVDECSEDGNNYQLYMVTLPNLKEKMSKEAKTALKKADCNIIFDSCTTILINGKAQGEMTSNGTKGDVYTTYKSLIAAQEWTDASKKLLKTFYGKEVVNLFCKVKIDKVGEFEKVKGSGDYCYGTTVTLEAVPDAKYDFEAWKNSSGKTVSSKQKYSFEIKKSEVTYSAVAVLGSLKINYFTGLETDGKPYTTKYYSYESTTQKIWNPEWVMNGYHIIGWNYEVNETKYKCALDAKLTEKLIDRMTPEVNLYAIWEPNRYTIQYHANGGSGSIANKAVVFTETVALAERGYTKANSSFSGWSFAAADNQPLYAAGATLAVSDMVLVCQLQHTDNAEIHLYAIWNESPLIHDKTIYVTLAQAQSGQVTEQWIGNQVYATDREDGDITYGQHAHNSLRMINFQAQDYRSFQKDGYIVERFQTIDSAGNTSFKNIKVYIVDVHTVSAHLLQGEYRFISPAYYKNTDGTYVTPEEGGLLLLSVWRNEDSYRQLLDTLFYTF